MAAAGDVIGPLVTCEWLHQKMTSGGDLGNIVIVDVSWSSQKDSLEEFKKCHIAGAQFLDVMVGPHTSLLPRNLPPPEVFQESARAAGISHDSHVIIYSDSDNGGFFLSGRAWWTFLVFGLPVNQVSILNGGLQRWTHLGYPTVSEVSPAKAGDFVVKDKSKDYRLSLEECADLLETSGGSGIMLVDSRADKLYKEGHVPGAANLPFTQLVDSESLVMKSVSDMKKEFAAIGKTENDLKTQRLVTNCNSGMSSCTMLFAAMLCGCQKFHLFHGGFTEWKSKCPDKIEK